MRHVHRQQPASLYVTASPDRRLVQGSTQPDVHSRPSAWGGEEESGGRGPRGKGCGSRRWRVARCGLGRYVRVWVREILERRSARSVQPVGGRLRGGAVREFGGVRSSASVHFQLELSQEIRHRACRMFAEGVENQAPFVDIAARERVRQELALGGGPEPPRVDPFFQLVSDGRACKSRLPRDPGSGRE